MTTTAQKWPNTLKAGIAAYFDTFSGLVPCKVLRVRSTSRMPLHPIPTYEAEIEITKTVGPYKQGETLTWSARDVVPKGAIKHTQFSSRILPYNIEVTQ